MSNQVFANNMEVSCKQGAGKSVCAFPDVCFTPPQTPATPPGVPIPYPNTGMDSDATDGSSSVKISGQEVMLKNKSYFKRSTGDEAGAAPKKGLVTSTNKGKVYFNAWSMDVKVEGENVVRHLDLTTHNHNPPPGQTPPWPFAASQAIGSTKDPCEDEKNEWESSCGGKSQAEQCASESCRSAQSCKLEPYGGSGSPNCPCGETGHHMIEQHWVEGNTSFPGYNGNAAPTVCADGGRFEARHGLMHAMQGVYEDSFLPARGKRRAGRNAGKPWTYAEGKRAALVAHKTAYGLGTCSDKCLGAQLDSYYGKDTTPSRPLQRSSADKRQSIRQREEASVLMDFFT
jgi:hypothetical protein